MSCRTPRALCTADAAAKAAATILVAADLAAAVRAAQAGAGAAALMIKPRVAITAGDPAGIGPEIAVRAAADPRVTALCEPIVYGPPQGETFAPGVLSAAAGRAAFDAIVRAVGDAQRREVHAVATAPVNKAAFRLAGLPWAGHT